MAHSLNESRIHGQDYTGASNTSGEINGLITWIMDVKNYVYSIHCFAHQLHLFFACIVC